MKRSHSLAISIACIALWASGTVLSFPAKSAVDISFTKRDQVIQNDDIELAATVFLPVAANGQGIVLLPGSGPAERYMLAGVAAQFATAGITVLAFDKRGSGESGGEWQTTSLDGLAGDASAALTALRAVTGVQQVGLWAHSQGNWVATRAIELGAAPDFLIAVAGGGVSPRSSEIFAYAQRTAMLSPAERDSALSLVDNYFEYLGGSSPRADLDTELAGHADAPWLATLGIERVLVNEQHRPAWQWVADYDPSAGVSQHRYPVLVLLGGADETIPVARTVSAWAQQLGARRQSDSSRIVVLPGRNHHLAMSSNAHGHGVATDHEIHSIIDQWLSTITLGAAEN